MNLLTSEATEAEESCGAIRVEGARTHNLKNVSIELPHNQLTVLTGVSGSGKSSLAFDTIYSEGQRQYIESLSTYARQFLDQLQRADVDSIEGLQPTLCIDQRVGIANPRSTVATVTEIYDYLRLLLARVGTPHCAECGERISQQSPAQVHRRLMQLPEGTKLVMLSPVVRGRKGSHRDALARIQKAGLVRVRVDGELHEVDSVPELAVRKNHSIEAVVDKIVIRPSNSERLGQSIQTSLKLSDGLVGVSYVTPDSQQQADGALQWTEELFSTLYTCAHCGSSLEEIEPRTFSFNSPYGACPECDGMGSYRQFDVEAMIGEPSLAPADGAVTAIGSAKGRLKKRLSALFQEHWESNRLKWDMPVSELTAAQKKRLFSQNILGVGLSTRLDDLYSESREDEQEWLDDFRSQLPCTACDGSRLRREALSITLGGKSVADLVAMSLGEALHWFSDLAFSDEHEQIARPILNAVLHRLRFLNKVGVDYLSLGRAADTLSGGELQRVRLATCIGSGLVGVCYILDEPSIGLHQRDNQRLIESLRDLQAEGNTLLVVEHDEAMMLAADRLVDIGPGAGRAGGEIVVEGTPAEVRSHPDSITAAYLRKELSVTPDRPRRVPSKAALKLTGASLNNLKNASITIPAGLLVGVTGVSGSGKSSLIGETLIPALGAKLKQRRVRPGPHKSLTGWKHFDKLVEITQDPIGRSPRSTPATYCGVFDLIRTVWAGTRESKQRGFNASRFSFNAGAGRCAKCQGQGQEKVEMNFLADIYVQCTECNGARYNRQTLAVRYRDKSIFDVLSMSVDEAAEFFENFEKIGRLLGSLKQVGLGYLTLGQSSTTLSGGESQRVKLATELAKPATGQTIYFLDEPTTGLHFEDVRRLLTVLNGLVDSGNTVLVIEHNLDVIRACDWLIDVGPEGGSAGGQVVATGSPEAVADNPASITGQYL